jgi:hypothetical protein
MDTTTTNRSGPVLKRRLNQGNQNDLVLVVLAVTFVFILMALVTTGRKITYARLAEFPGGLGDFVTLLKGSVGDPKIAALMNAGLRDGSIKDDRYEISRAFLSLDVLFPTQSQIDLDKSVGFYLNQPASKTPMLDIVQKSMGTAPFDTSAGGAITVARLSDDSYVIIDGHHRWSQQMIFAGPRARIECNIIRAKEGEDAIRVLKLVQLAIAAVDKKVPSSAVDAKNDVFQMDPPAIFAYYNGLGSEAQKNYALIEPIVGEAAPQFLFQRTLPVRVKKPAYTLARAVMPQLDAVSDTDTKLSALRAGIVNVNAPF